MDTLLAHLDQVDHRPRPPQRRGPTGVGAKAQAQRTVLASLVPATVQEREAVAGIVTPHTSPGTNGSLHTQLLQVARSSVTVPPTRIPTEYHHTEKVPLLDTRVGSTNVKKFPSDHPTQRSEVFEVASVIDHLMARAKKHGAAVLAKQLPGDVLPTYALEHHVWAIAGHEMVRQTTAACTERGTLLGTILAEMNALFESVLRDATKATAALHVTQGRLAAAEAEAATLRADVAEKDEELKLHITHTASLMIRNRARLKGGSDGKSAKFHHGDVETGTDVVGSCQPHIPKNDELFEDVDKPRDFFALVQAMKDSTVLSSGHSFSPAVPLTEMRTDRHVRKYRREPREQVDKAVDCDDLYVYCLDPVFEHLPEKQKRMSFLADVTYRNRLASLFNTERLEGSEGPEGSKEGSPKSRRRSTANVMDKSDMFKIVPLVDQCEVGVDTVDLEDAELEHSAPSPRARQSIRYKKGKKLVSSGMEALFSGLVDTTGTQTTRVMHVARATQTADPDSPGKRRRRKQSVVIREGTAVQTEITAPPRSDIRLLCTTMGVISGPDSGPEEVGRDGDSEHPSEGTEQAEGTDALLPPTDSGPADSWFGNDAGPLSTPVGEGASTTPASDAGQRGQRLASFAALDADEGAGRQATWSVQMAADQRTPMDPPADEEDGRRSCAVQCNILAPQGEATLLQTEPSNATDIGRLASDSDTIIKPPTIDVSTCSGPSSERKRSVKIQPPASPGSQSFGSRKGFSTLAASRRQSTMSPGVSSRLQWRPDALPGSFASLLENDALMSSSTRPRSLKWLNSTVLELYDFIGKNEEPKRSQGTTATAAATVTASNLGLSTVLFFRAKYGLPKMADGYVCDMLNTLKRYAKESTRARMFAHWSELEEFTGIDQPQGAGDGNGEVPRTATVWSATTLRFAMYCFGVIRRVGSKAMLTELDTATLQLPHSAIASFLETLLGNLVDCLGPMMAAVGARMDNAATSAGGEGGNEDAGGGPTATMNFDTLLEVMVTEYDAIVAPSLRATCQQQGVMAADLVKWIM